MTQTDEINVADLIHQFGEEVYLDEKQFSQLTNIPIPTLRTWRSRESGPPYVRIGKRVVRYHWGTAKAYLKERTVGAGFAA